jgi:hypothetical protein
MNTLLDTKSLAITIDNVSEVLLSGKKIGDKEKSDISNFIVSRHGKPGSYANMFAPMEYDLKNDLVLFTGEKIKTNAGICHMLGEESSRILRKLNVHSKNVEKALSEADEGIIGRINAGKDDPRYVPGTYCCKSCTCSLWLNLSAGGLENDTEMLKSGLKWLKKFRDSKGRWQSFPFYYTLYVLTEIDPKYSGDELKYVAEYLKNMKLRISSDKHGKRRGFIINKILEMEASL